MIFAEALKLIDSQVFAKIGRRLTTVEKIVLEAAWEDEGYDIVASKSEYESNYLRGQVAPKLWMLLSPIIGNGKKVSKKKLRSILEESVGAPALHLVGELNIQESDTTLLTSQTEISVQSIASISNLGLIQGQPPNAFDFYGRKAELRELKQLALANRCVVLYGPVGIGKSTIAARLVEEIAAELQPSFNYVIWKSVYYAPSLESLIDDLLKTLPGAQSKEQNSHPDVQSKTSLLVELLQRNRCLLVLDEAEAWLQGDRNKGFNIYDEKYAEYGIFFRRLIEEKHDSCIVLTSQEPFKDMIKLQNSRRPVYSFKLGGLDFQAATAILSRYGLSHEHKWETLLAPYLGNPSAIERVASKIDKFFGGDVAKFLNYKTALTSEVYRNILLQQFQPGRLTSLEKQILFFLVEKTIDAPTEVTNTTFIQLVNDIQSQVMNTSLSQIMEAIDTLDHRSLVVVSKNREKELLIELPVLAQDYLKKRLKSLGVEYRQERGKLFSQLFNLPQTSENFAL